MSSKFSLLEILKQSSELERAESADAADTSKEEAKYLEVEKARESVLSIKQDRLERKNFAGRLLSLVVAWLIGVFVLLVWQGFGSKIGFFSLPESVLHTLLATTTINLIGLLYVVSRYLFNDKRI